MSDYFDMYEADLVRFKKGDYVFWLANDDDDDDAGEVWWGKVIEFSKSSNLLKIQFSDRVTFIIRNIANDDASLFTADEGRGFAWGPGWTGLYEAIYDSDVEEFSWLKARASAEIIY